MALTRGPEATLHGLRGEAGGRRGQGPQAAAPRAPIVAGEPQEDGRETGEVHMRWAAKTQAGSCGTLVQTSSKRPFSWAETVLTPW